MEDRIAQHRTLVKKAANRHWRRIKGKTWLEFDDLLQAGFIALVGGLSRYDPAAGNELAFLWKTVYLGIQKEISNLNHTLYVSQQFSRYAGKIGREEGPQDATEWASRLGITEKHARALIAYIRTVCQSLDVSYDENGEGFTLHEIIGTPDYSEAEADAWDTIFEWLCKTEFEMAVLKLTYAGYAQREIAAFTNRPEYSVYKAFRRIKERYKGGKADEGQEQTPRTKKKGGPRARNPRQRLTSW